MRVGEPLRTWSLTRSGLWSHLAPGLRNAPTSSFFLISTLMTGTLSAAQRSRSSVMCWNCSSRFGCEAPARFLWLTRSENPIFLRSRSDGARADVGAELAQFGGDLDGRAACPLQAADRVAGRLMVHQGFSCGQRSFEGAAIRRPSPTGAGRARGVSHRDRGGTMHAIGMRGVPTTRSSPALFAGPPRRTWRRRPSPTAAGACASEPTSLRSGAQTPGRPQFAPSPSTGSILSTAPASWSVVTYSRPSGPCLTSRMRWLSSVSSGM